MLWWCLRRAGATAARQSRRLAVAGLQPTSAAGSGSAVVECRGVGHPLNGRHQAMAFVPIRIREYVRLHLKSNPDENAAEVTARLRSALEAYRAGHRCYCGAPIWVIGSAEAGLMCFTCITGESDPSEDYEIAEACDKSDAGVVRPCVW